MYANGVPTRRISAWLQLWGATSISYTAISDHMKTHTSITKTKSRVIKTQSTEAAGYKNATDPNESADAKLERVFREKYLRDAGTVVELENEAVRRAGIKDEQKEAGEALSKSLSVIAGRNQDNNAFMVWQQEHVDELRVQFEQFKSQQAPKTKSVQEVNI
jgi:hypothetical protein